MAGPTSEGSGRPKPLADLSEISGTSRSVARPQPPARPSIRQLRRMYDDTGAEVPCAQIVQGVEISTGRSISSLIRPTRLLGRHMATLDTTSGQDGGRIVA